ncbi:MerR family transcriptional regulator [Paenisporosarcina antarctica]|uniref:MerR family transcriptional regulator n=1 Tax=Paenisporosarcina antarctica TaxID=417367 RepID=A0A4P7A2I0_9BACL|nr:MerR family transcriptional regulator [Paenisporosarcina antarctica]QBP42868.1 MerR family transcriptional regulator [Paenisporosarcina antarctica]
MYKIRKFSELTGLSKETLRYYEQEELLEPAFVDPSNNYRYYDDGSYFLAILLQKLRSFGCSIQEMKVVMRDESFKNLEALLLQKKDQLQNDIIQKQQTIFEIEEFILTGKEEPIK